MYYSVTITYVDGTLAASGNSGVTITADSVSPMFDNYTDAGYTTNGMTNILNHNNSNTTSKLSVSKDFEEGEKIKLYGVTARGATTTASRGVGFKAWYIPYRESTTSGYSLFTNTYFTMPSRNIVVYWAATDVSNPVVGGSTSYTINAPLTLAN